MTPRTAAPYRVQRPQAGAPEVPNSAARCERWAARPRRYEPAGAGLKELMARLGQSSTRAALMYRHASRDRDQAIAWALGGRSSRCARRRVIMLTGAAGMRHACGLWPMHGPSRPAASRCGPDRDLAMPVDLRFLVGAGEGNRTLMTSLEGWGSAIELRPRARMRNPSSPPVSTVSVPVTGPSGRTATRSAAR